MYAQRRQARIVAAGAFACSRPENPMPYFTRSQNRIERGGKLAADVFSAALLLIFAVVFFGPVGGLVAFLVLEAALLAVDYVVPSSDDEPGVAVR
jgi:hypothetical protein